MKNVLILGFFDGVHLGHRAVISSAVNYSKNHEARTILITFKESPSKFFNKTTESILSRDNSVSIIKKLGVDEVVELDFSEIADTSADIYLQNLCEKYSPLAIFTGFNHTFGCKKTGTPKFLEQNQAKYGYEYHCIPPQLCNGEIISSSGIKEFLRLGDIKSANLFLGNCFFIEGIVKHGAKIGRQIGFPTANIDYPNDIVKVPYGVYKVQIEDKSAVLNWGMKPTVNNTLTPIVEAHILDFNQDIYGKKIRILFIKKIRNEKKFSNLTELKNQINEDIKLCTE